MKRLFVILPLLLLLFSCGNYRASRGPADWIYVSETGNDGTGDGTSGAPYATVSFACTQATSGDTVYVMAGTINETAQILVPVGVSICGAGPTSIIHTTYASGTNAAIVLSSTAGASTNGNQSISYLTIDGNMTARVGVSVAYRNNVVVHHCTLSDFLYHGITFNGTNQSWTVNPTNTSTGNKVHNCTLDNVSGIAGVSVGSEGGVRIMGQTGFEFHDNISIQNARTSGDNGDNIKGYANKGLKVYNNQFIRRDVEDGWNFYSEFHYSWGGTEVYNNVFIGGGTWDASGNVSGDYDFGIKIYGNHFTTTTGAAVSRGAHRQPSIDLESFTYSEDIYVYGNKFVCVDIPISLGNIQISGRNIHIHNNLMLECENLTDAYSSAILIEPSYSGSPIPLNDIYIYNNVMTGGSSAYAGISITPLGLITNLHIKNNIMQGPDLNYPVRFNSAAATTVDSVFITNNVFNGCVSNDVSVSSNVTITNYTKSGNITSDPLFRSSSYRLQSTSPAINAGLYVGLTTDFAGHRVPQQDTVDIGAYEYGDYLFRTPSGKLLRNANGKLMITH